jgi:hypothetical protein
MKILKTLLSPVGEEGINQLQMGMKKHSADPDVQPLHNLCSCLRNNQPGMSPVDGAKKYLGKILAIFHQEYAYPFMKKTYIASIMDYCKISA